MRRSHYMKCRRMHSQINASVKRMHQPAAHCRRSGSRPHLHCERRAVACASSRCAVLQCNVALTPPLSACSSLFGAQSLRIRQFDEHATNAHAVWPECRFLAGWLSGEREDGSIDRERLERMLIHPPQSAVAAPAAPPPRRRLRVLELGAACGALSLFLAMEGVCITASDIDDEIVTSNLRANAEANGVRVRGDEETDDDSSSESDQPSLRLLPHTWGRNLDSLRAHIARHGPFDVIVASDILNYEKEFGSLVDTLSLLMPRPHKRQADEPQQSADSVFYMVWKRRGKGSAQAALFFDLLRAADFDVQTAGAGVYEIRRKAAAASISSRC